ncbi:MotA/TolQ/ExbB proton channel family protein [Marivirga arenosa]|uniref:MotA/TolQ/ExbB proton channel family protein n=1 Tax=Marivirga arenosa TaxID=3059076 RepID=A0AA49GFK2_9BACT|nr:MotA/TolQ/ExbB proton channel family protein [Marivirga sp. BKB1-2]WKK82861.1 MotA/TolQ/ExbB proton channel family protein [Marivirga sp. BKB1-2]
MSIIELHFTGGILFMGILFLLLVAVIITSVIAFKNKSERWLKISQEIALFALVFGILGQLVGLFGAFEAIEQVGEVSQALLAGGLKVSSYPTLYGFFIFLVGKGLKIGFSLINK